jgi:transglutaminase-like putative cysteine protease
MQIYLHVCDLRFRAIPRALGYGHARVTKTAADAFIKRRGVCRDFAHLRSRCVVA